jgi:hypothetical protein
MAAVFSASFRLLNFPPMLHTVAEDCLFIANVILRDCEVTLAEDSSGIVSFLARQGEQVRLLHTRPDLTGRGAGTQPDIPLPLGTCRQRLVANGRLDGGKFDEHTVCRPGLTSAGTHGGL